MTIRNSPRRGATMVEFTLVSFLLMIVIFAGVELDRLVLVYTTLGSASRAGVRYAIVHGSDRTGASGSDPASGPGNTTAVETKVRQFASMSLLGSTALNVSVQYPTNNKPGSLVTVSLTYPYNPFLVIPLSINLHSSTRGIIVF